MSKDRFEELYRSFRRLVGNLVRSGRKKEDAEDVAQEAMLETWKRIDQISPGAEVSYVRRVGYTRGINQATRTRVGEPLDDVDVEDKSASSEAQLLVAEFQRRFGEAFSELPELTRHILILRKRGHSFEQIAKMIKITSTATRSRFSRAAKHLRERVDAPPQGVTWLELPGEDDDDHEK